jgi:arylsulfatase A-like enzyme
LDRESRESRDWERETSKSSPVKKRFVRLARFVIKKGEEMMRKNAVRRLALSGIAAVPMFGNAASVGGASRSPNVIVILADDLGYADLGCYVSEDVKTPHIDTLAENGVRCTAGYVTAPQCGPSRAALLTGRYQNRFGFESNEFAYEPGIPMSETLISTRMKELGYVTGYIGKWGVGHPHVKIPPQRGFDESFWNTSGNRYFPESPSQHHTQMFRGAEPVDLTEYSTDAFGREAVDFIHRHHDEPFFLMTAFVTPHVPMEALQKDLVRFSSDLPLGRRTLLAMMANLDDNVGRILEALREKQIEENTLIVFLSDNGGYPGNYSLNDPYSGTKSQMLEGGIRVPFIMQWKGRLPAGTVYEKPVISLDIAPTALAAAGAEIRADWNLDGVNLFPFLSGKNEEAPHESLFWRFNIWSSKPEQDGWAVRQGDWKLVRNGWARTPPALYNLKDDPAEKKNLAAQFPEKVSALRGAWEAWDAENVKPGSGE